MLRGLLLALLFSSASAFSAIDLTVKISAVNGKNGNGAQAKFSYKVKIKNIGDQNVAGTVRVKGFLIPDVKKDQQRSEIQAVVLPNADFAIDLHPAAEMEKLIEVALPNVTQGKYFLGALVNSNSVIQESSQMNNTSDLVEVRSLANEVHETSAANDADMYFEAENGVDVFAGRLRHRGRLIFRGSTAGVTTTDTFGRFMLADLEGKKLTTLKYQMGSQDDFFVEKRWGSFGWNQEKDAQNRAIGVDYYSFNTELGKVAPGNYLYLVLANSRDLIQENHSQNNLHVVPITVEAPQILTRRNLWFVAANANENQVPQTVTMMSPYADESRFSVATPNDKITFDQTSGALAAGGGLNVVVNAKANRFNAGENNQDIQFKLNNEQNQTVTMNAKIFVQGAAAPALQLPQNALELEGTQSAKVEKSFVLKNTGHAEMKWVVETPTHWLTMKPTSGTIPAGGETKIIVVANPYSLRPTGYQGVIQLSTNASNTHPDIAVNYTVSQSN